MKNTKLLRGGFLDRAMPYLYGKHKTLIFLLLFLLLAVNVEAQCAMCKAGLESDMKAGGNAGRTINIGILFLLGLPYIIVGSIAFVWLRNRKIKKASMEAQAFSQNI